MVYVKNELSGISKTINLMINKIKARVLSSVILKYSSRNMPDALLFERKGGMYGTFALRYKL